MRATIEAHNIPEITKIMEQLGTTNPSVAMNFIIHCYRTGKPESKVIDQPVQAIAEPFDELNIEDWGD